MVDMVLDLFGWAEQEVSRRCVKCQADKPRSRFYQGKRFFSSRCKDCHGKDQRTCTACARPFIGKASGKYCSKECRYQAQPRRDFKRACGSCLSVFHPNYERAKYCSVQCRADALRGAKRPRLKPQLPKLEIPKPAVARKTAMLRVCLWCDITFKPRSKTQKYCSRACSHVRLPELTHTCRACSQTFLSKDASRVLCSKKCETIDKVSRLAGANSHFWRGGTTAEAKRVRTSAAYKAWRKAVFERDGYCCQECGAKSGKGCPVELHPDHIKPFALYPELRLDIDNGRTLCAPCHRKTPTYAAGTRTLLAAAASHRRQA